MNIETKFKIGDTVSIIECFSEKIFKKCPTCEGTGKLIVKDKEFECPECYGSCGNEDWLPKKWDIYNDEKNILYGNNKVVNIRVEVTRKETKINYLLGHKYNQSSSGTLWNEDVLFATKEEALAECEKRNKELETK